MNKHKFFVKIVAAILILAMAATSVFTLLYYIFAR